MALTAHYLFRKTSLPADLNDELNEIIVKLSTIKNNEEYLYAVYDIVSSRYKSSRVRTVTRLLDLLATDAEDLWNRSGFLHCTNQNYLVSTLLVKSGRFNETDIRLKWTMVWYCAPHQYMKISVGKDYKIVDCWGRHYGIPYGQHARRFNTTPKKTFMV